MLQEIVFEVQQEIYIKKKVNMILRKIANKSQIEKIHIKYRNKIRHTPISDEIKQYNITRMNIPVTTSCKLDSANKE